MVLTKTALNELRTHLSFTQLRFYCSKNNGRTIHVTTAANSIGEAVVQYFSGQTDAQPASCGSYVRMENDNSYLGGDCKKWKNGKWGIHNANENRLYNHVAYVYGTRRWLLSPRTRSQQQNPFLSQGVGGGEGVLTMKAYTWGSARQGYLFHVSYKYMKG